MGTFKLCRTGKFFHLQVGRQLDLRQSEVKYPSITNRFTYNKSDIKSERMVKIVHGGPFPYKKAGLSYYGNISCKFTSNYAIVFIKVDNIITKLAKQVNKEYE
jgi:hypothetical protein